MKQSLSKREKILIFSAALLVFLYLIMQFIIYPLFERYFEYRLERDRLLSQKATLETDIANISSIQESNRAAIDRFELIKKEYPLLIPNEEIDPILTTLCVTNGLKPTTLRFTDSAGAPLIDKNDKQSTDGEKDNATYLLTIITVSMNMTGSYNSLMCLLEEVDTMQYIRITNLGYAINRQEESIDEANIALTFELTFITQ